MRARPDVVLLDLRMPDGDGLWALREMRRVLPDTKVIVLSMFDDHQHVHQAMADGATGYIIKTSTRTTWPRRSARRSRAPWSRRAP